MTRIISAEELDRARTMRAEKVSWNEIGRRLGYDRDVIRFRIDAEFRAHRSTLGQPSFNLVKHGPNSHDTEAEIRRLQDTVPRDTRRVTARVCGDPLPGRSALDRKLASPVAKKIDVAARNLAHIIQDRHSNSEAVD